MNNERVGTGVLDGPLSRRDRRPRRSAKTTRRRRISRCGWNAVANRNISRTKCISLAVRRISLKKASSTVRRANQQKRTQRFSVLSLTENTQRYKSLPRGFAICSERLAKGEIFKTRYKAYALRYALRGVRGFISYRIGAKRQYIARAKRVYRVHLS